MNAIEQLLDYPKRGVRAMMHYLAVGLDIVTFGKISPNFVTAVSLLGHVWVAYLIATRHPVWAAGFLIIFGLMDSLDGELARLQNRASASGMFLDSVADRVKEAVLYVGIVSFFLGMGTGDMAILLAVAALGASIVTSYTNAWGEVALAKSSGKGNYQTNKVFRAGLGSFEVRTFLLVVGLFTGRLDLAVGIILALAACTIGIRTIKVTRVLRSAQG